MSHWINHYNRLRNWLIEREYEPNEKLESEDPFFVKLAVVLFIVNIMVMIRGYAVSNILESVLFFLFVCRVTLRRELIKAFNDPLIMALAWFVGWILLSSSWSDAGFLQSIEDVISWRKLLLIPLGLVLLWNRRIAFMALAVLMGMGIVYLGFSIIEFSGLGQWWGPRDYNNIAQDANVQGIYFSIVGLAFILLPLEKKFSLRCLLVFWSIAVLFFIFVSWLGISRSGYVAFAVTVVIILSKVTSKAYISLILGVIISGTIFMSSTTVNQRWSQAIIELKEGFEESGGEHTSGSIRSVMWKNTVLMIVDKPFLGTGAGAFSIGYAKKLTSDNGWRSTLTDDPHNQYLHIAGEYGLIGLMLFVVFLLLIVLQAGLKGFGQNMLAAVVGISLLVSFFNGVFGGFAMGRLVCMSLVIFMAISRFERREIGRQR